MGLTNGRPADTTIRRAVPADADTIAAFTRELARETEAKVLDAETVRRGVRAVFADADKGFYTVAERAGEPVGCLLVTFEWSDWRAGWFRWIQSVYVRPDARRSGVFRALYDHLLAEATADPEVVGLRLYVERSNDAARRTYDALGMAEEGYDVLGIPTVGE